MRALDWLSARVGQRDGSGRVDQLAPWLFIGPALSRSGIRELPQLGVTHLVDLRSHPEPRRQTLSPHGLKRLWLPVPDHAPPTDAQLLALLSWLDEERQSGSEPVLYLHCRAGVGRTPTVATALLMQEGLSLPQALRIVSATRPEVAPTDAQLAWLEELQMRSTRVKHPQP